MPEPRAVLELLTRDELAAAAERHRVIVWDRRSKAQHLEAVAASPDAPLASVVSNLRTLGSFREIADLLWQNAERFRGAHEPNAHDKVILPLLVLQHHASP